MLLAHLRATGAGRRLAQAAAAHTTRIAACCRPVRTCAGAAAIATLRSEITAAISIGAPLYNRGRPADCYSVYRGAAQRLASSPSTPAAAVQLIRAALVQAAERTDPSEAAWTLRHAFDLILGGGFTPMPPAAAATAPLDGALELPVLDCSNGLPADAPRWQVLDDVVMGGASSSCIAFSETTKALVFSGNVTTAFNGGFASVRSLPWNGWAALGRGSGVRLLVRGDGRVYKLNLKTDDSWDGVAWQADFQTTPANPDVPVDDASSWQVVDLPFSAFRPNLRGRVVDVGAPLQGSSIRQVGFMVSKFSAAGGVVAGFREGPFSLAVRAVRGINRLHL